MRVVVMAQGRQSRFEGVLDHPKQLLRFPGGGTVLGRTLEQLRAFGGPIAVVASWDSSWDVLRDRSDVVRVALDEPGETVLNGLWQMTDVDDDLVVLLGDVVFSSAAMDAIYFQAISGNLRFFGRRTASAITGKPYGELFALTLPRRHRTMVRFVLSSLSGGKLWDLLRLVERNDELCFFNVDDYTDDVDTPDDLVNVWPKLCEAVAGDP